MPTAAHSQTLSLDNVLPIALTTSSTQSALSLDPASGNVVLRSSAGNYNQCSAPMPMTEPSADKFLLAGNTQLGINNSGAIGLVTANPVSYLNRSVADGRRVLSMRLAQPLLCADFAAPPGAGSNPVAVQFVDPNGDSSGLLYGGIGTTSYLTNGAAASQLQIVADSRLACCVMLPAANANCFQGLIGGASSSTSAAGPGGIRGSSADLAVAVTGPASVAPGANFVYTITVGNVGGASVSGVRVRDWFPKASGGFAATLSSGTWTCSASGGASCGVASGSGNLTLDGVSLNPGANVSIVATRTLSAAAGGTPFSVSAAAFAPPSANETALANNQGAQTSTVQQSGLSINDVTQVEGSGGGTTNFQFTITRSSTASAVSVQVGTANGSALAGSDYTAISGQTVNFTAGGAATAVVNVSVNADALVESNETFTVNLTNPVGAAIADAQGVGTINNDDSTSIATNDVSLVEGNSGTTNAVFTVTLVGAVQGGFTVPVASANGTATSPSDYTAIPGGSFVSFTGNAGETRQVNVPVNGDTVAEPNETFQVVLGTPSVANVTVSDGTGVGTINNDDSASISINDVNVIEGNVGFVNAVFSVTLNGAVQGGFSVQASTAAVTASAGIDYTTTATTLNFAGSNGETETISVPVIGDVQIEADEFFVVNLGVPSSGLVTVSDGTGVGTISNDD